MPVIPDEVYINTAQYSIVVDGKPLPWLITTDGPTARRLADDLYAVGIKALCSAETKDGGLTQNHMFGQPALGGIEVPWPISPKGFVYKATWQEIPTLEFEFLARNVVGDIKIVDERESYADSDILDLQGNYWKFGDAKESV